jgi:hypothetical protein
MKQLQHRHFSHRRCHGRAPWQRGGNKDAGLDPPAILVVVLP